jgi:hypothetical protein
MSCNYPYVLWDLDSSPSPIHSNTSLVHVSNLLERNKGTYFLGIPYTIEYLNEGNMIRLGGVMTDHLVTLFQTYKYDIPMHETGKTHPQNHHWRQDTKKIKSETWDGFLVKRKYEEGLHLTDDYGRVSKCFFDELRNKIILHLSKVKRFYPDGSQYTDADSINQTDRDATYILNYMLYELYHGFNIYIRE